MLTRATQGLLYKGRRLLCPNERRWVVVPVLDVIPDVSSKSFDRVKGAASNGPAGENAEPCFNHVEPGCSGRSEMKVNSGMSFQPGQDLRCLMGGGVIQHHMQILFLVPTVEYLKKPQKIRSGMSCRAF